MDSATRRALAATRTPADQRTHWLPAAEEDAQPVTGLTVLTLVELYNMALQAPTRTAGQQDALETAGIVLDRLKGKCGVHERIAREEAYPVGAKHGPQTTPVPAHSGTLAFG